jgi:hypothetical protein
MKRFRVQVEATEPDQWRFVWAEDERRAAVKAAVKLGIGERTVYVELGRMRHPNGSPVAVNAFRVAVRVT